MYVGGKSQSTKNKQSAKHNNKTYFNIGTCDLARHMHKKIWDIS
jgi:hypothetical protein